ncbi:hypothetical protein LTR05_006412 [Lithohypha guttulata]|uniref:RGS domain-containing protein n=1 Tax=Lithohypha guttulata TaxID=1690604 RepID=A0AAN7SXA0_9EURO|nr:hypothetical protein LTR05_006412 [Lithohypha guttulata]
MRRLPLLFTAMSLLHLYGVLCYVAYGVGVNFPCAIEYWDMNLLLPLGIALFQVANSQFLHIARQQEKYLNFDSLDKMVQRRSAPAFQVSSGNLWQRIGRTLNNRDRIIRMVVCVVLAMGMQIALSLFIFLVSEKFHKGFGLFADDFLGTNSATRLNCARGWEWWLSILWQVFWSWIYAPYILWRSKDIKDTYGWRVQTIRCCISGLPASPLWLCALYLDAFEPVNAFWIPPQWFVLSITLFEAFALIIPCYHIYRQHSSQADILGAVAGRDTHLKPATSDCDFITAFNNSSTPTLEGSEEFILAATSRQTSRSTSLRKNMMYTMSAMEHALKYDAARLQQFAALKDFSGENISFLTHLSTWHRRWRRQEGGKVSAEHNSRRQFNGAIRLYATFVAVEHAEFPINISSRALKALDEIFAGPTKYLLNDTRSESTYNSATPFNLENEKTDTRIDVEAVMPRSSNDSSLPDDTWYSGEIPPGFDQNVFVEAENEIKYLVLTNTWPKFVNAGYQ